MNKLIKEYSSQLVFLVIAAIYFYIFFKNAWVSDDAYINFRSIEQLFAGNGPNWNFYERVQSYTSPLWFWLLALGRVFSDDLYYVTMMLTVLCNVGILFVLRALFPSTIGFICCLLLFLSSNALFDYSSSGLETPLCFLLIAVFFYVSLQAYEAFVKSDIKVFERYILYGALVSGVMLVTRHDLLTLIFPTCLFIYYLAYKKLPLISLLKIALIAAGPLAIWTTFSLLYYGVPLPNTAYAKLNTGIPQEQLFVQSISHIMVLFKYDFITLFVLIVFPLWLLICERKSLLTLSLVFGVCLNLVYIIKSGGGFMMGRFFSYAYFLLIILFIDCFIKNIYRKRQTAGQFGVYISSLLLGIALLTYIIQREHTPITSDKEYKNFFMVCGISDERGVYSPITSWQSYINNEADYFPDHGLVKSALWINQSNKFWAYAHQAGIKGYWIDLDKALIDPYALSDPLMARLPVMGIWRTGHFERIIPPGYFRKIHPPGEKDGPLVNPSLEQYYQKLAILVRSEDLFSLERLKTIVLFNLGRWDHLIDSEGLIKGPFRNEYCTNSIRENWKIISSGKNMVGTSGG